MIGGVLVERTVADVLPELESNRERLPKAIQALQDQLTKKGQDINEYIETHDIRVQRADRPPETAAEQPAAKSNVLVASGWHHLILITVLLRPNRERSNYNCFIYFVFCPSVSIWYSEDNQVMLYWIMAFLFEQGVCKSQGVCLEYLL